MDIRPPPDKLALFQQLADQLTRTRPHDDQLIRIQPRGDRISVLDNRDNGPLPLKIPTWLPVPTKMRNMSDLPEVGKEGSGRQ